MGLEPRSGAHFCVARPPAITFAVVGRNEAQTLPRVLRDACAAAGAIDRVWFVDSGSTDDSADRAAAMDVPVIAAPVGKGRALRRALLAAETPYICVVDADLHAASKNIPARIAAAARRSRADMIVGDFAEEPGAVNSVTCAVYEPLVARLFPEAAGRYGGHSLSGFRALRTDWARGGLPPDFGVEAHLNISFALRAGARLEAVDVGRYSGPFRYKPTMGLEVGRAILDLAQAHGRLTARARGAWDAWLDDVVAHIATYRGDRALSADFAAELARVASRPLPSPS